MAIININDLLPGFAEAQRQKLEFVFRYPLLQEGGVFGPSGLVVAVDATTTETYNLSAQITTVPVESGTTLSDHIHINPQTITIAGIITQKPLEILPALASVPVRALLSSTSRRLLNPILGGYEKHIAAAGVGLIQEKVIAPLLGGNANRREINRLYWNNVLKARFEAKQLFSIRSEVGVIENCFFQSISWNRQRQHGDSLFFTATIQEVQTINSDITLVPLEKSAQKTANIGKRVARIIEQDNPNVPNTNNRLSQRVKQKAQEYKHKFKEPNVLSKTASKAKASIQKLFRGINKFRKRTNLG